MPFVFAINVYIPSCGCDQDVAVGLSWREETELRKALYASMQKQKHHREKDDPPADGVDNGRLATYVYHLHFTSYFAFVSTSNLLAD